MKIHHVTLPAGIATPYMQNLDYVTLADFHRLVKEKTWWRANNNL